MRYTIWAIAAAIILAAGACGSPEQPPAKPPTPTVTTPSTPLQQPTPPPSAPSPTVVPTEPARSAAATADAPKTAPAPAPSTAPAPPPPAVAARPAVKLPQAPETITLAASQGPVTLPHLAHAKRFPCASCHGEGSPGKFDLSKDAAHALCRDCHKAKGAGPTSCTGCHRK